MLEPVFKKLVEFTNDIKRIQNADSVEGFNTLITFENNDIIFYEYMYRNDLNIYINRMSDVLNTNLHISKIHSTDKYIIILIDKKELLYSPSKLNSNYLFFDNFKLISDNVKDYKIYMNMDYTLKNIGYLKYK